MKMLSKYPVTGSYGEYKVDLHKSYVTMGMYQWVVKVYKYYPNRKLKKYKKLHKYESGWGNYYDKYIGKYIELATEAVKQYENIIEKETTRKSDHEQGIKEFELWDGKIN